MYNAVNKTRFLPEATARQDKVIKSLYAFIKKVGLPLINFLILLTGARFPMFVYKKLLFLVDFSRAKKVCGSEDAPQIEEQNVNFNKYKIKNAV